MLKVLYAGCPSLPVSLAISAQFTLEMSVAVKNCQKSINLYFGIQGHWFWCQSKASEGLPISN